MRGELEIVVLDNGSTDGSSTLDSEFPAVTFMRLPRNFGATKALNIGMRTAAAEYFLFLSPAMEVQPDTVAALAAVLDQDPDAAAVSPLVLDESGKPAGDWWKLPDPATLKDLWRDPNAMPRVDVSASGTPVTVGYAGRSALMVRKFFIRGLNYFDDHYGEFGADLDLAFQIRRSNRKTVVAPQAVVKRHTAPQWPDSAQKDLLADRASGAARFLSKHYGFAGSLGFQVGAALGSLARLQVGLVISIASGSKIDGSQGSL